MAIVGGWYATSAQPAADPPQPTEVPWVRTSAGWEKAWWLRKDAPAAAIAIHPGIAATLMLFSSVALLSIGGRLRSGSPSQDARGVVIEVAAGDRL